MEAAIYRLKLNPLSKSHKILLVASPIVSILYGIYKIYHIDWELIISFWSPSIYSLLMLSAVIILFTSVSFIVMYRLFLWMKSQSGPESNFLRIDGLGLNYMRRGKCRSWAWAELSDFRMESRLSRIEVFLRGTDPKAAKRDPWVQDVTPRGPYIVIADIYDASLDEIMATLNAYRPQAIE